VGAAFSFSPRFLLEHQLKPGRELLTFGLEVNAVRAVYPLDKPRVELARPLPGAIRTAAATLRTALLNIPFIVVASC
jgi:hypothetical protein